MPNNEEFNVINTYSKNIRRNQYYSWDFSESYDTIQKTLSKDTVIGSASQGNISTIYHTGTIDNFIEVAACNMFYTIICDYKNKLWCWVNDCEIRMHSSDYKTVLQTYVTTEETNSYNLYYNDKKIQNQLQYNVTRAALDNLVLKAKKIKKFLNDNTDTYFNHPESLIIFYINEVL